jgi:hypothetical protein
MYNKEIHRRQSNPKLPLAASVLVRSSLNHEFYAYQTKKINEIVAQRKSRDLDWLRLIASVYSEKHRNILIDIHTYYTNRRIDPPPIVKL